MPDWIEIVIRTVTSVLILFAMTKILGKRQISQLSLFEYITGISIGNIAAYVSLDLDNLWYLGIVSLIVWVSMSIGMEYVTLKSRKIRDFVDGKATVLIKDGRLFKNQLHKERLTLDELLEQLRKKDVYRVADVEFAVMEPSGEINVMLKKQHQPITPDMLGWRVAEEREAMTVIMDGEIRDEALFEAGLDHKRLERELKRRKLDKKDVLLAQVDGNGKLFAQTTDEQGRSDRVEIKPRERVAILAEHFEAELNRLERLASNESDRHVYRSALDRFHNGIKPLNDKSSK
ncbi:DUF421 domain-containing protein [Paenibacillus arenilitoris]|uniref:DUF421 domain-containing protein n=1 Tax=Paenibacillus arenilitoris TaxID=2772299 RepID=A0A927CI00_9BACL|nr:DUF421 domain-containing protein [Paenibacillus arenilitoris]MBD2868453.1 DUF421 domain-containing protein [Paenibacillus arenilitoris]